MDDGAYDRLPRRPFGVQSKAARGAIERVEGRLREAQERIEALEAQLRERDQAVARYREEESRIAAALIEAERAAQRVVAEARREADATVADARREADAVVAAAEERQEEIAAYADDLWERCHFFLDQLRADLERHGDPRPARARPTPTAGQREPDDHPTPTVLDDAGTPPPIPPRPREEKPTLEAPPPGRHIIELEFAPVRSATHVADLERQIVKLNGVQGVRIARHGDERVAFLVGMDTPDLDVSPLLSENVRLRAAERDRIVLDVGENGFRV